MFGPYRLIRTIGEGEFGKVKLAVHMDTNKEVAIKIKKENIESPNRRSKLMREITVLQSLLQVRLFCFSVCAVGYMTLIVYGYTGGELFEHILAHRYLKEREACRFFAQLIAGVSYVHNKGIVHRDLKLENLLLDANRNIIITDFGFANMTREEGHLLQTSCGSPCYAAPELVISDGYVGEAAMCGVVESSCMLCSVATFPLTMTPPTRTETTLTYFTNTFSKPNSTSPTTFGRCTAPPSKNARPRPKVQSKDA
ncbi:kinase-like domain-containing protein [Chytridium lagenaria]|nr:kinase-like domain-containing protein [Chytridium lagenaria]